MQAIYSHRSGVVISCRYFTLSLPFHLGPYSTKFRASL